MGTMILTTFKAPLYQAFANFLTMPLITVIVAWASGSEILGHYRMLELCSDSGAPVTNTFPMALVNDVSSGLLFRT